MVPLPSSWICRPSHNHLTRTRSKRIHLPAGRGRRRVVITVDRLWGKTRRRRSLASLIISAVSPLFRFPLFWFCNKKAALWPSELFVASKPLYTLILSPSPLALGEKLQKYYFVGSFQKSLLVFFCLNPCSSHALLRCSIIP